MLGGTRFNLSGPRVSAAAAVREMATPLCGRRPLRVPVGFASSHYEARVLPFVTRAAGARPPPARGHCLEHDSRSPHTLSVAIPILTFNSPWHEHRVQAYGAVNGRSGKPAFERK